MDPLAFCKLMMSEYEEQWTEAHGHQERHPLKVKMKALEDLIARVRGGEDFEQVVREGCAGEEPVVGLLCDDLWPRWQRIKTR